MEKDTEIGSEFSLVDLWRGEVAEHQDVFDKTIESVLPDIQALTSVIYRSLCDGGKLILFGNGGSAADAQHLAAELVIRYKTDRKAISAISLTTDTSILTACGNDLGFDLIFSRQIEALGKSGDVALGISTSGNSKNVLTALTVARRLGLQTVGFTGAARGRMTECCDVVVAVPSLVTARIQEMHIMIGHVLCKSLEMQLGLVK